MHVLMTADGVLVGDQQRFVKGLLERGILAVSVLGGGYKSLRPFFVEPPPEEQRALAERAQEAKQVLQKGLGNLNALWQKAPTRQRFLERVGPVIKTGVAKGSSSGGAASPQAAGATFERAPVPPALVGADSFYSTSPAMQPLEAALSLPLSSPSTEDAPAPVRGGLARPSMPQSVVTATDQCSVPPLTSDETASLPVGAAP